MRRVPRALRSNGFRNAVAAIVFLAAAALLWRQLRSMSWSAFWEALRATEPFSVLAAIGLTLASYACLSGTEWFALRVLGHPFAYRQAAMVAVPAYALTNSAGFSPATGVLFRLQAYGRMGLGAGASTSVAALAGAAVTLSGLVAAGVLGLAAAGPVAAATNTPLGAVLLVAALLAVPGALWFYAFTPAAPAWLGGRRPVRLGTRRRALGLAAGVGDWLCSGAALFILVPHADAATFPLFLFVYVAGSLISAATGVPGGLGVFEAIVLGLSGLMAQVHETAAALLLYRCLYSLGPLGAWGAASLVRHAIRARKGGR